MFWKIAFYVAKRQFVVRHAGSVFGFAWNFLKPLLLILVFTFVFSRIVFPDTHGIDGGIQYGIFLAVALIPWRSFTQTISQTTVAFPAYGKVILSRRVPLAAIPTGLTFLHTFLLLCIYVAILGAALCSGITPSLAWLALPGIIVTQQLLGMALGTLCACVHVYLRDLGAGLEFILRLWFWMTPIAYHPRLLPEGAETILALNPYAHVVECYRGIIFAGEIPLDSWLVAGSVALVTLAIAVAVLRRSSRSIPDML
jgi:ABC-type polysaccharide/polyol phosphate export permease